jgi:6-pyruvoyltetrahydropterin/6-carboxytetrahydropterin synthase
MMIFKQFTFDSAHYLPNVSDKHKCKSIHGHTYRLTVFIEGEVDAELGWVIDFAYVKTVVSDILGLIDHKLLNEVNGLENPTCEILAAWLWNKIKPRITMLKRIELYETPTSGVVYNGPKVFQPID